MRPMQTRAAKRQNDEVQDKAAKREAKLAQQLMESVQERMREEKTLQEMQLITQKKIDIEIATARLQDLQGKYLNMEDEVWYYYQNPMDLRTLRMYYRMARKENEELKNQVAANKALEESLENQLAELNGTQARGFRRETEEKNEAVEKLDDKLKELEIKIEHINDLMTYVNPTSAQIYVYQMANEAHKNALNESKIETLKKKIVEKKEQLKRAKNTLGRSVNS